MTDTRAVSCQSESSVGVVRYWTPQHSCRHQVLFYLHTSSAPELRDPLLETNCTSVQIGCGRSFLASENRAPPQADISVDMFVEELAAVKEALGLREHHVLGHGE